MEPGNKHPRSRQIRLPARLVAVSWRDLALTAAPVLLVIALGIWLAF